MRRIRDVLLRQAYRVAYRLMQPWMLIVRPHSRGVKCLLTQGEQILLVRHTYGPRLTWHLPGGGKRRGESSLAAGEREMAEELGLRGVEWSDLGVVRVTLDRRPVSLGVLHAELSEPQLERDRAEIAEARWFAVQSLPARLGPEVEPLLAYLAAAEDA